MQPPFYLYFVASNLLSSVLSEHISERKKQNSSGATRWANEAMAPTEIFSLLGALTGIRAPRIKGPRKVAPNKGPIQRKGSYKKGTLQIKDPYTDKGPSQTRSSYRQGAPTDKGLQ